MNFFFGNTVVEAFIKFYPSGTAKIMLTFNCIFWFSLDKHIVFLFQTPTTSSKCFTQSDYLVDTINGLYNKENRLFIKKSSHNH